MKYYIRLTILKKHLSVLLAVTMLLAMTACSVEASTLPEGVSADTQWAVYWYLCGSDLESNYGAATNDLLELTSVKLPENVKVVIQTGGASIWQNDVVSADTLGRYKDGMDYIAQMNCSALPELLTLNSVDWENMPVTVDENGNATLTLGSKAFDILSSLTFELYYADPEEDILLCLGTNYSKSMSVFNIF